MFKKAHSVTDFINQINKLTIKLENLPNFNYIRPTATYMAWEKRKYGIISFSQ